MSSLSQLTAHELSAMLDRGECTSREIVEEVLASIRAKDEVIGAYLSTDKEDALKQADAADARRQAGDAGPLCGIPVTMKDLINVEGHPCHCASHILEGYRSPYDATVSKMLREEGAVLLGRANMDEFAMGSSTENSGFKPTRNPWDTSRVPGGSSGGSAAAVASDESIVALGSDTGGSIRQPAAFCGCVGLKPTYGRVSRYGLTAFASSLDQIGPLTKDVKDSALLLQAIAGHDAMDSTSIHEPVPDYASALVPDMKGVTIGLPKEYFIEGVDTEVEQAVRKAIDQCRDLGAEVKEVSLPHTSYAIATYYIIATAEASANLARFDGVRYGLREDGEDPIDMYGKTRAAGFGTEVKRRIILGTYVLSSGYYDAYYLRAQKVRTLIQNDFRKAFEECDVILTPTTPTVAFKIDEKTEDPLQMYLNDVFTATGNLGGICGISLPCGFNGESLPIGLQVLGPAFGEEKILRAAYAYEQSQEWKDRKP